MKISLVMNVQNNYTISFSVSFAFISKIKNIPIELCNQWSNQWFLVSQSIQKIIIHIPMANSVEDVENYCNRISNEEYEELQLSKEEVDCIHIQYL